MRMLTENLPFIRILANAATGRCAATVRLDENERSD
jgi:hypothetical protein